MTSVKLPLNLKKCLEVLAIETGRTKTYYIKETLLNQIEAMEDRYLSFQHLEKPLQPLTVYEAKH